MVASEQRIILVDPEEGSRRVLASRLHMQGYQVVETSSPAEGARLALSDPPAALVADLWMPGISGVQLCRLLKAEAATIGVPIVLRGPDGQRNRFWAERAGAAAYITKGRMGDLVRTLARAIAAAPPPDEFFTHLSGDDADVRDRIAAHLDQALFESVLASEVRALGTCGAFDRLFDLFSQFVCQVTSYRWLAISTMVPLRFGLHCSPQMRQIAEQEARHGLGLAAGVPLVVVEDEDAFDDAEGPAPLIAPIVLGLTTIGQLALAVREPVHFQDRSFVDVLAREVAGPIRMASLVEESQLLARVDPLTGLMNRRSFRERLTTEVARARRYATPLSCILLDIDHFKRINDGFGHAVGDAVLAATGPLLGSVARATDLVARWGGEEFVVALHDSDTQVAMVAAQRIRQALQELIITAPDGSRVPVTASLGVAELRLQDTLDSLVDRADQTMYEAKIGGRNRVAVAEPPARLSQLMGAAEEANVAEQPVAGLEAPAPH
jgi:two-component system cell cycle response regulator